MERWYVSQFAYLVNRLKSIREGAGTLLDSTAVVFLACQGVAGAHAMHPLPCIVAGSCGGFFKTGRFVKVGTRSDLLAPENPPAKIDHSGLVPHNRFLASLCNAMGVPVTGYGEPRYGGPLEELRG